MSTVLIVTVGGSPQPILTALQQLNPDRAIFLCSTGSKGSISQVIGEDKPCKIRRGSEGEVVSLPNIPTQARLEEILSAIALPSEQKQTLQEVYECCIGFEAWDRFDHQMAWDFLQHQMENQKIQPLGVFLKRILSSRESIDETFSSPHGSEGHGYEIVQDLLLNAQRRAAQEWYDDAIGRLYRALELLAQIRLFTRYKIKTNNVEFNQLLESLQTEYESQRPTDHNIRLGLRDSYTWLSEFPEDPLGQLYQERDKYLKNALNTRNNSLFAHGFQPIDKTTYDNISQTVIDFIQEGIARLIPTHFDKEQPQFPTHITL